MVQPNTKWPIKIHGLAILQTIKTFSMRRMPDALCLQSVPPPYSSPAQMVAADWLTIRHVTERYQMRAQLVLCQPMRAFRDQGGAGSLV